MNLVTKIFLSISFLSTVSIGYKILVIYPGPFYSHQLIQKVVSTALLENGHELVLISPNKTDTDHENLTYIELGFIRNCMNMSVMADPSIGVFTKLEYMIEILVHCFDQLFSIDAVNDLIKNPSKYNFDAIIVENSGFEPLYAFADLYDAPLIGLTSLEGSFMLHEQLGNVYHPVLHPPDFDYVPEGANFIQRVGALYKSAFIHYWFYNRVLVEFQNRLTRKYFNTNKSTPEILADTTLMIETAPPELGHSRPILPNTIQTGFLHIKPNKPLPADLQLYLDSSKHGVIYISFGTTLKVSDLSDKLVKTFLQVFAQLKYDVLWTLNTDELPDHSPNVKFMKWVPQQDLLTHKNVKLFFMQGGAQSREEAVWHAVPMLVVPLLGDQLPNADRIANLGIGKKLLRDEVNAEVLLAAITELIDNPKYKENIVKLSKTVRDTPMTPIKNVVWWIEYAIRNKGASHLKYKGAKMPFVQYYFIDIILVHLVLIVGVIYVLKLGLTKLKRRIVDRKVKTN